MNRLFRFKGPPGSGKSTAAKQMLRENPGKMKRINMDLLREMLDDGDFTMQNEKFAGLLKRRLIDTALRRGFDVIDDNTNFSEKGWYETCEIAAAVGDVQVIEKAFIISKKECLTRNAGRPNPVPDHIIHTMFDKHVTGKKVEELVRQFKLEMGMESPAPATAAPAERTPALDALDDLDLGTDAPAERARTRTE